MEHQRFFPLLLVCFFSVPLRAQNTYDFHQFGEETVEFVSRPAHWNGKDALHIGYIAGGTALAYQYDRRVRDHVLRHPNFYKNTLIDAGGEWGSFFVSPILSITLITKGWTTGDEWSKKTGFEIAQSVLYVSALSVTLKTVTGRARPYTGKDPHTFYPFSILKGERTSFPAGHVDAAFALSTVLAMNTDSPILKGAFYVPAGLTVANRIYNKVHWLSDCVAGAALGYYTASWVVHNHERKAGRAGGKESAMDLKPYLEPGAYGLELSVPL